jgi:hypothetical protein
MRFLAALLVTLMASTAAAQQLVQAQNDNLSYGPYAVGWPSSVIAFRFTAAQAVPLAAAQVFTGNQAGAVHSLELRSVHPTTGLPDQLLAGPGSWTVVHARCWQGAQFASPFVVQANTDYFLVWRVQGMFPQHSVCADNLPGATLGEVRYSDGNNWHAQANVAGKFRLFAPSASGAVASLGVGKPGFYGVPTIGISGWPAIGSSFDVWLDNAARIAPSAPANVLLLVGFPVPAGLSFGVADVFTTGEVLLLQRTWLHQNPTAGACSYTFAVPAVAAATGLPLAFQWGIFDPAAADGLAHSAAVVATLP